MLYSALKADIVPPKGRPRKQKSPMRSCLWKGVAWNLGCPKSSSVQVEKVIVKKIKSIGAHAVKEKKKELIHG